MKNYNQLAIKVFKEAFFDYFHLALAEKKLKAINQKLKTKNQKPLLLFTAILIFTSCTKEPVADFTADKIQAYPGETIEFTNLSKDAETVQWQFGDGITSTAENPNHAYQNTGSYTVTLTAYSKKERKQNQITRIIEVVPCLQGYTGLGCTTQVAPTTITIDEIRVYDWPLVNSTGGGWDNNSGPDLFIEYYGWGSINLFTSGYYQDVTTDFYYSWSPNIELSILDYYATNTISVFDYDDLTDHDLMGAIEFTPYSDTNGFPQTQTLLVNDWFLEIHYLYTW